MPQKQRSHRFGVKLESTQDVKSQAETMQIVNVEKMRMETNSEEVDVVVAAKATKLIVVNV